MSGPPAQETPRATTQATYAATLVDEWVRCGVTHAVVAPGSRSTPLALALAADGRLSLHVHHDERSAAFLALGIGLRSGIPAVVLTTSGTAAVELHPAVVEASHARVPLLVCTADRPPELLQIGAPQTVDQTHLFGRSVRWFAEPGVADPASSSGWRSLAARAYTESVAPVPGPVHLNLAFRDPLVGEPGALPPGRPGNAPWHRMPSLPPAPAGDEVARVVELLQDVERGVVVAGGSSGDADAVHDLATTLGWPVLADPRAPARRPAPATVAAFDAILRHEPFATAHRPDVVLRLGDAPASKVLGRWLASAAGAVQVAIEAHGAWLDPDRTAAVVAGGDPTIWCRLLIAQLRGRPPAGEGRWAAAWGTAEKAARRAIDDTVDASGVLTEPGVARAVARGLPEDATLVVSSSMPVRDLEWYAAPRTGLRVVANRGANGIDGVVSTAVGVAAAGGPTALLIGDVAFLHDTNGLLGLAGRGLDLTIVVVDNAGGGIFSFLPQAAALPEDRFERLFGTPHTVDLAGLAAVHGVRARRVEDVDGFDAALAAAVAGGGPEVLIAPTDRAANPAVHERIHGAVAAALERSGAG